MPKNFLHRLKWQDRFAIGTLKDKITDIEKRDVKIDLFLTKFTLEELGLETVVIRLIEKFKEISFAIDNKKNKEIPDLIAEFLKMVKELKAIDEIMEQSEELGIEKLEAEKKLYRKLEKLDKRYIQNDEYFTKPAELKEVIKKIIAFIQETDKELDSIVGSWKKIKLLIEKAEKEENEDYTKKTRYTKADISRLKDMMDDILDINRNLTKDIDKKRGSLSDYIKRCSIIKVKLDSFSKETEIDLKKMIKELS